MSANDNSDPLAPRARSHDDQEHEGGASRRPDPSFLPSSAPAQAAPSMLPDAYLQARQGNFYDSQSQAPAFPGSFLTQSAPAGLAFAAPAVVSLPNEPTATTTPASASLPNQQYASGSFYDSEALQALNPSSAQVQTSAPPFTNMVAPASGPTPAVRNGTRQGLQQPQQTQPVVQAGQPQLHQLADLQTQNAAAHSQQSATQPLLVQPAGSPTPYVQDRRPVNLPMDATVQMPGRSTQNIPIDCTVQMRGRTKDNLRIEAGIPWEKSQEPIEEEEKILPLPVPPPPPSSTNNRLPAMQRPVTTEELQSQIQQAASGSFNSSKLDAIPTPRQAVRYKPATPTAEAAQRPKMVDPVTPKKRRATGADINPNQRRTGSTEIPAAQSEAPVESKRVRINPKLLKPTYADDTDTGEDEVDTEFVPRRYNSHKSGDSGFSWSELQYLVQFYFREVRSLFVNPHEFFVSHVDDTTLGEPITFMILSGGIAAVFISLSGNIGDASSTLFGTCAYTIISAIAVHYAMQWMGVPEGELKSCFKIVAYSQAPLLVSWIKLGSVPVGWLCAFAYSMYLCMIGLEQVFEMDRQRAIVIVAVVSVVIRGLLHLIGL